MKPTVRDVLDSTYGNSYGELSTQAEYEIRKIIRKEERERVCGEILDELKKWNVKASVRTISNTDMLAPEETLVICSYRKVQSIILDVEDKIREGRVE